MPFLCCFGRNPFLSKSKRASNNTSGARAPRMVQLQRDTQPNATTVAVPKTKPATKPKAQKPGLKKGNLDYIDRQLANNSPPASRALNPNQKWHLPSYAPPPPRASPATSRKAPPQTRYRLRDQPHPIYASGTDNDTVWIRNSDYMSSCGIGSPLLPVPKKVKKKDTGWTSSPPGSEPEMTYYIETAPAGRSRRRDPYTTPPGQIIRRAF